MSTLKELARQHYYATRATVQAAASDMDDDKAVLMPDMFDAWDGNAVSYKMNDIVSYGTSADGSTQLYRVITAHTSQADWTPDVAVSLFVKIDKTHAGTLEDPIPYSTGMEIFKDKYYTENGILYLCIRDSGQALYNNLADLVGNYVQVV